MRVYIAATAYSVTSRKGTVVVEPLIDAEYLRAYFKIHITDMVLKLIQFLFYIISPYCNFLKVKKKTGSAFFESLVVKYLIFKYILKHVILKDKWQGCLKKF